MLQWNTHKSESELPPEIGVLGAPALQWNAGQLGQTPTYDECHRSDPNFTQCHRDNFRLAQNDCASNRGPYPTYDACVEALSRQKINQSCIPACEAYLRGGAAFPWDVYSADTCTIQRDVNSALRDPEYVGGRKAAGTTYNAIAEDCKMGPATCGALDFLGQGTPASCQNRPWRAPTPSGTAPPYVPPVVPPVSSGKKKGGAGLALLGFSALAAIGAALVSAGR